MSKAAINMSARIDSLIELAKTYNGLFPDYGGTIERLEGEDGPVQLRYYKLEEPGIIRDAAILYNNAVDAMDRFSKEVAEVLVELGEEIPHGTTEGARLMHWLLKDSWPPRHISAATYGNAFVAIIGELHKLKLQIPDKPSPDDTPVGSIASQDCKYPGLEELYWEMKGENKNVTYRAIASKYRNGLSKSTPRPQVDTLKRWLERPERPWKTSEK